MPNPRFVSIYSKDLDAYAEVTKPSLHVWLERGWVEKDPPAGAEVSAPTKTSAATPETPVHATHRHKKGDSTAPAESA